MRKIASLTRMKTKEVEAFFITVGRLAERTLCKLDAEGRASMTLPGLGVFRSRRKKVSDGERVAVRKVVRFTVNKNIRKAVAATRMKANQHPTERKSNGSQSRSEESQDQNV